MSLNRYAPKRDGNEPGIRSRFKFHGWHTEHLSGKGVPDLLCWPSRPGGHPALPMARPFSLSVLVDVKEPAGKPTPAQVEKWTNLSAKGIPVYVARTEADVDAIVAGSAVPWGVMEAKPKRRKTLATGTADAGKRLAVVREPGKGERRAPRAFETSLRKPCTVKGIRKPAANYTPPRTAPADAAREAEATFAPAEMYRCDFCKRERPRENILLGEDALDRHRLALRGFNGRADGTPWPTAMCLDDRDACDAIHSTTDV